MEAVQSDPLAAESEFKPPNPEVFTELSFKVDANITELTFQYIDNFGKSLAAQFHLPTPALLFHKITEGSFTITWRVLSYLVPHICTKVPENASFFEEKQIQKATVFSLKRKQHAKVSTRKCIILNKLWWCNCVHYYWRKKKCSFNLTLLWVILELQIDPWMSSYTSQLK